MSDTPDTKTPQQSEAFLALVEAIGDALYILLSDETFTEEEAEETKEDGEHDDIIIEVDDVIDEDYQPTEE